MMVSERVERFLEDIRSVSEARYAIVQELRGLILAIDPGVSEEVKYGGLLFSADVAFCGVFSYAKHVSLELSNGAQLTDPHQVLEGGGKFRRHIKFRSLEDIETTHAAEYLEMAYKEIQDPRRLVKR